MLTSVLFFTAKGAELKSAIISEMDKQNRPSWQVWLGATEGRQAAYCPPTGNDVSVKGCCMVEAACEVNLSRHTAESSRVVVFTKTLQVRREWGLAQCGTHFLAGGEENNLCPESHRPVTWVWEGTLQLRCSELRGIITKRGSCLLHSIKYVLPSGLFFNRSIKP